MGYNGKRRKPNEDRNVWMGVCLHVTPADTQ